MVKITHWNTVSYREIKAYNIKHDKLQECCSTDGTQHERNYPVAPAPMPGSPIQLLTELFVA